MNLLLLFSFGTTLETWKSVGFLDREHKYYTGLISNGVDKVSFLTYGDNDKLYEQEIAPIEVLPKRGVKHLLFYSLCSVFVHWRAFKETDLIKSNQSNGAWVGLIAKIFFPGTMLVTRCGWVRTSEMMTRHERLQGARRRLAKTIEWLCYRFSNAIVVTTPSDRRFIVDAYNINAEKVKVIPNTVDTELFKPGDKRFAATNEPVRVLAIGRLAHMKNVHNLILAAGQLGDLVRLTVVGGGDDEEQLKKLAVAQPCEIEFIDNVDNSLLPGIYRAHDVFIMPQLYASGMSKVMIEAMACGLITIGSDLTAHREVITNGVNGYICDVDSTSIAECIKQVVESDRDLLGKVSKAARDSVVNNYSMAANIDREYELYNSLVPA